MNTTLTADEVRFQLESLSEHLAPVDLRLLLQIAGELSPTDHSLGVDQALATLYPKHEHKAATDALGKLRARLALAAKADGRAFELTVSGSKKAVLRAGCSASKAKVALRKPASQRWR